MQYFLAGHKYIDYQGFDYGDFAFGISERVNNFETVFRFRLV